MFISSKKPFWKSLVEGKDNLDSSTNIFDILKKRSQLLDKRPQLRDGLLVKKIGEGQRWEKREGVEVKRNILNLSYFVVSNPANSKYLKLDEQEKFIWDHLDGHHTVRDLAVEFFYQYGGFAYEKIIDLVLVLKKEGFLTEDYVHIFNFIYKKKWSQSLVGKFYKRIKSLFYNEWALDNLDEFFGFTYKYFFSLFFSFWFYPFYFLLILLGFIALFYGLLFTPLEIFLWQDSLSWGILSLLILNSFSLLCHEFGHALTTKHYGRKINRGGFLFYFFTPALFVDTTDMWFENKERRIKVSLAGVFVQAILAGIAGIFLLFLAFTPSFDKIIFQFIFITYVSIFWNLTPFWDLDGYFVLMDCLEIPCLRYKSFSFLRNKFLEKIKVRERWEKKELIYFFYALFSFLWGGVFLAGAFLFWQKQIRLLGFFLNTGR